MGRVVPLTDAERDAIAADLRAGMSCCQTAKKHGRSTSTVAAVATKRGLDLERSRTKKASAARRDYNATARLELLNLVFDKAREMLPDVRGPHQLQALSIALGILIDKRRLEDGEATSRIDDASTDARDRIARRIDELAQRRRARALAGGAQSEAAS